MCWVLCANINSHICELNLAWCRYFYPNMDILSSIKTQMSLRQHYRSIRLKQYNLFTEDEVMLQLVEIKFIFTHLSSKQTTGEKLWCIMFPCFGLFQNQQ